MLNQWESYLVCIYFVNFICWYLLSVIYFSHYLHALNFHYFHLVDNFLIMIISFFVFSFLLIYDDFHILHSCYHISYDILHFFMNNCVIIILFFVVTLINQREDHAIWDLFLKKVSIIDFLLFPSVSVIVFPWHSEWI
jgi:hypothetical protein